MAEKEYPEEVQRELLKLENQYCFALYVCSKEMIRKYRPLLEPLGLTFTAYLVMLVLWEEDTVSMNELGARLYLDSGTLTPVLKSLEKQKYLYRRRSEQDERYVLVTLTEEGRALRSKAVSIPAKMYSSVGSNLANGKLSLEVLREFMDLLLKS